MKFLPKIAVIGLGYVGLPLAVQLAKHFSVVGFDIKRQRIDELRRGIDRTGEIEPPELRSSTLKLSQGQGDLGGCDFYIITVPTPVDKDNRPDLTAVKAACRTIGGVMARGATVVLESTVYPGVTENICGPELDAASGLQNGRDFFLGYSPERINPGDREHRLDRITKVVAGQTPDVARQLVEIYGAINGGRVFVARDIRTAEAAKVIENAQRDINIAFINEVTQIFHHLGLSIYDVLDASRTKWNFLPFTPGLVGGHCIGVDPFYLANLAQQVGHDPQVILAGRRINDAMGRYLADRIADELARTAIPGSKRALVLGLAFKENVPDLRNSKVVDVIQGLRDHEIEVDIHDPLVDADEAHHEYGLKLLPSLLPSVSYDAVIGAVAHDDYRLFTMETFSQLVRGSGFVVDIKGMWRDVELPARVRRWQL
jgi:UDP-N-acetyl-D-glucosamine/UDP-N-acetyl-D-galactosamine dehydrogenase